jgi:hypothetical protein
MISAWTYGSDREHDNLAAKTEYKFLENLTQTKDLRLILNRHINSITFLDGQANIKSKLDQYLNMRLIAMSF